VKEFMAKIYYCTNCKKLIDREGFLFEVFTDVTNTCPECNKKCKAYDVNHSKLFFILLLIVILFSLIFFFLVVIYSYNNGYREEKLLMVILLMLAGCTTIVLGFGLTFSMFDINNIGNKLYNDISK
jgi:uncharacterized protein (DUF983 family)